jgi:hypothetical protein
MTTNPNPNPAPTAGLPPSTNILIASNLTVGGSIITSEIQLNPTGGNPQGITINGTSSSGDGTQIYFQESGTTYWQLGPNYSTNTGSEHQFWLYNPTTQTNILEIQNASNVVNFSGSSSYPLTVNCNGTLNVNTPLTTVNGETSGAFYWTMPFQGPSYKKVIVYFDSYVNDSTTSQSITFPTAFTTLASITSNSTNGLSTSTSNPTLQLSNTELTINPDNTTVYTGIIIIEGF